MAWWLILILVAVVIIFLLIGFFWWGVKKGLMLALNGVIGFFALHAVQVWWLHELKTGVLSTLITALFGIFGFLLVLILHFFGWAF